MTEANNMNVLENDVPTRRTLLSRLRKNQDDEDWVVFFDLYWRLIYGFALKFGLSDADAQDVVQETIITVHRKLPEFHYDPQKGSFKSWLFTLTKWKIMDHVRQRQARDRLETHPEDRSRETPLIERIPDESGLQLERLWDKEWTGNLQAVALDRVKQQVDHKQFQIFDLYVSKEWPARKVSQFLKVSLAQVYLAKHRITKLLTRELRRVEATSADATTLALAIKP